MYDRNEHRKLFCLASSFIQFCKQVAAAQKIDQSFVYRHLKGVNPSNSPTDSTIQDSGCYISRERKTRDMKPAEPTAGRIYILNPSAVEKGQIASCTSTDWTLGH